METEINHILSIINFIQLGPLCGSQRVEEQKETPCLKSVWLALETSGPLTCKGLRHAKVVYPTAQISLKSSFFCGQFSEV